MKGQLALEYMISFSAFITLVALIYLQYSANIPNFIHEINKEDSRSKAYQISELLINDPGEPSNWDDNPGSTERLGLSDEASNKLNLISLDKIITLNTSCNNNYQDIQKWLGLNQSFSIHFYNITGDGARQILLDCNPPSLLKKTEINAAIIRITSFVDSSGIKNFGELVIEV